MEKRGPANSRSDEPEQAEPNCRQYGFASLHG